MGGPDLISPNLGGYCENTSTTVTNAMKLEITSTLELLGVWKTYPILSI